MERWELQQLQGLPLELKVLKSKQRIKEWYEHYNGDVYVSFSGGKDSTVLLRMVRELYPDVPAVFIDTGLEYPRSPRLCEDNG
jgi:3'-phosphoadenosine 5'-phosphosulfate sulfotransferase (PAPS reductase)/FAD synthetase